MLLDMATSETRADRGRRIGRSVLARLVGELVEARKSAGLSQQELGRLIGWSQPEVSRWERLVSPQRSSVVDVARIASVLGLKLNATLFPLGEPLRDAGHQALVGRFVAVLSDAWRIAREVPLPNPGDQRAWDLVLRVVGCI